MMVSPSINISKSDLITRFCYGCARNHEEKLKWKNKSTTDVWKLKNSIEIKLRMRSWQLDSFEKSYNFKCKNGISLEKKRKNELND